MLLSAIIKQDFHKTVSRETQYFSSFSAKQKQKKEKEKPVQRHKDASICFARVDLLLYSVSL